MKCCNHYLRRMSEIQPVNLRSFKQKARHAKTKMRRFLSKLQNKPPHHLDKKIADMEPEVWKETDCLSCANCCKTMTPTFNEKDLRRISAHFKITVEAFKKKWLKQERGGDRDWMNKSTPCQFLNLEDNKCSIYEIRPDDCRDFPHLYKKFKDYGYIHKQNVEYCPATYKLVEKMMSSMNGY